MGDNRTMAHTYREWGVYLLLGDGLIRTSLPSPQLGHSFGLPKLSLIAW